MFVKVPDIAPAPDTITAPSNEEVIVGKPQL